MRDIEVCVSDWRISFLFRHILDNMILKSCEKPMKLYRYNGMGGPNQHVEHEDIMLDYHHPHGVVKCKLFVLTFKGATMTWF